MFFRKNRQDKQSLDNEEKKLVRTLDWHVMPLFSIFFFLDYLDRSNIGYVQVQGMAEDTGLTPTEFSLSIAAFYIAYIISEIPINTILKRSRAGTWLASMMLLWGIITASAAFVTNFAGFFTARFFLGIAQSGFIPGIMYQVSSIYRPEEMGLRTAILFIMAYLSGIISGPMAYALNNLEGYLNLHSWQYIFLFQGIPTIIVALIAYKFIFNDINEVRWLTDRQKELQLERIPNRDIHDTITLHAILDTLKDWKTWCFSIIVLLGIINLTSMAIFIPTLISGFGFSALNAELLSTPLTAVSAIVALITGLALDRYNWRSLPFVIGSVLIGIGCALLVLLRDSWALYGSLFVVSFGMGLQSPVLLSWPAMNFQDSNIRAVAIAIFVMASGLSSVFASFMFPRSQGPHYVFGKSLNLLCALTSGIVASLTGYMLHRENCRLDRLRIEQEELGNEKLQVSDFRYLY